MTALKDLLARSTPASHRNEPGAGNRPLPPIGARVRMLADTNLVKPRSLKGEIGEVMEHYPGYSYYDEETDERLTTADSFAVKFNTPTGYNGPNGPSYRLALHCDAHNWVLLSSVSNPKE